LGEALALAREANGYTFATLSAGLDRKAPWFQIKEDRAAAATSVYVILRVVDNLKTLLAPILPHTAQRLHEYLGYEGAALRLRSGQALWHPAGGQVPGRGPFAPGANLRPQRGHRHLGQE
jgi:methionyl-tRNA synthetase